MTDALDLLLKLSHNFEEIKNYILALKKSELQLLTETWIDSQDVMQALHISKRTLQSLRDAGTLPYSRLNGKFYYKVSDIKNLLESNYTHTKASQHGNK